MDPLASRLQAAVRPTAGLPTVSLALLLIGVAACTAGRPTKGPVPRRPAAPGGVSVQPPPRPQYTTVGPRHVSAKPGSDVTRAPLESRITPETDEEEATALRYADRARAELEGGTTANALVLLDAAIDEAPDIAALYVIRAQAHLAEGSAEQARADLERAVAHDPSPAWLAEAVAVNGGIFELEGNRDAAMESYRRALSISAANVTARDALRRLSSQ